MSGVGPASWLACVAKQRGRAFWASKDQHPFGSLKSEPSHDARVPTPHAIPPPSPPTVPTARKGPRVSREQRHRTSAACRQTCRQASSPLRALLLGPAGWKLSSSYSSLRQQPSSPQAQKTCESWTPCQISQCHPQDSLLESPTVRARKSKTVAAAVRERRNPGYQHVSCPTVPYRRAIQAIHTPSPMATSPQSQAWSPLDGSSHQHTPPLDEDNLESSLNLSPQDAAARQGVLSSSIFPSLKNDAHEPDMESPEEMQRNDPLGTQIWKLYSKARTQLPNAERMENLTWRMMAMKMRGAAERERERERNKGYGCRHGKRQPRASPFNRHLLTLLPACAARCSRSRANC